MKQDMEVLQSHLKESPYVKIISNIQDNGHDDDLPFEEYEDLQPQNHAMIAGARNIGGPRFAQYNQQPLYADAPQDIQYAEQEIYQQEPIQSQYQRFQPAQQIPQVRQQPILQQQGVLYDQGFQFQQVGQQQILGQQQTEYESYDQNQYQPLIPAAKVVAPFKQQPIQKQIVQPAQGYPIKAQPQNLKPQVSQQLYPDQQQVPYKTQQLPPGLSYLPGQNPQLKTGFDQQLYNYGGGRPGGQNLSAHKLSGQAANMDMMVAQQVPNMPVKSPVRQDSRYRGSNLPMQESDMIHDEGYGKTQQQPYQPYKEDRTGYKQPYPGQQQKAKPALNNPPNQYYQKPKPDYYATKPQSQGLKQGQQQFKPDGQYQGLQDSGQKSYQSGMSSQYQQQQYSDNYPEYPNQATSQKQSSHKESYHSSSQSAYQQTPLSAGDLKKNQNSYQQQPQSGQKKSNIQASPTEIPYPLQQASKGHKQQNVFDNNIMEVPETKSDLKTPKAGQIQPSQRQHTPMHSVNEKFIDDTVENVNKKPGFNKLKKKLESSHSLLSIEEYFMQVSSFKQIHMKSSSQDSWFDQVQTSAIIVKA